MSVDLSRLQSVLMTSGIQTSNNALYQVISQLINELKSIEAALLVRISNIDTGAISALHDDVAATGPGDVSATIQPNVVTYAKIQAVSAASKLLGRGTAGGSNVREISIGSNLTIAGDTLDGIAPAPLIQTFVTSNDETGTLANSRQMIDGEHNTVNNSVANKMSIDGDDWSVLTNGDPVTPELIFAGGDVIMIFLPS